MKKLLLSMACGALLLCIYPAAVELAQPVSVVEPTAYVEQVVVEQAVVEQVACLPSMGCNGLNCTDPTHYHHCAQGCTDPSHYHDCPLGCRSHDHGYCGRGHHGGRGSRYGRRHH